MNDSYIIPSRGLKLIGIRFYPYDGQNGEDERKAMCIQKSLYNKTKWFYFNKGFTIDEDGDEIKQIKVDEHAFDSSSLLYSVPMGTHISVSAIVGQNGTGKSTIVDTIVRLLNNLSAAIIGEDYVYSSAQHLHYIDNVYASLAVYVDSAIKVITCKGRKLSVTEFHADLEKLAKMYYDQEETVEEVYEPQEVTTILDGTESNTELLPAKDGLKGVLKNWFYTLVSNYSLYAYNYRDYIYERSNDERIVEWLKKRPNDNKEEDAYWLKGVFHKNDGYQTPVVIHPMRENGYVNVEKVNYLGKQNLLSLCFEKRDVIYADGTKELGVFPFRTINQTHHIVAFYFYTEGSELYNGFVTDCLNKRFDLDEDMTAKLSLMEKPIKDFWSSVIGVEYKPQKINNNIQKAWDYLTYKTIKVLWTYNQYKTIWENVIADFDEDGFKKELKDELLIDFSHRTQKIRRTVAFLRFYQEREFYLNQRLTVSLDDIYGWMSTKIGQSVYPDSDLYAMTTDDLLPPPFIDVVLQLVDNEHLEAYKNDPRGKFIIPFSGLSSGERQIAYTLGNIVYHLKNIESGMKDMNHKVEHVTTVKYNYVNILLDEVELYFHPDLQRRFVSLLLDAIKGLQLDSNTGINITLVTHSPFVLSDIPEENILCLSREEDAIMEGKTFAANIHDLFNNTFILPNTIGEYAQRELIELISYYQNLRAARSNNNGWRARIAENDHEARRWTKFQYLTTIIGDEYLSEEVKDMVDEIAEWKQK